jgi:hypothetical protein
MSIQLRRGTNAERSLITPLEGELIYTTDTKTLYVGDGTTAGGVQVTNPGLNGSLSGNIDLNNYGIFGYSGNLNIDGSSGVINAVSFVGGFNGSLDDNLVTGTNRITNGTNLVIHGYDGNIEAGRITATFRGALAGNLTIGSYNITNNSNITINGTTGGITASSLNTANITINQNIISSNTGYNSATTGLPINVIKFDTDTQFQLTFNQDYDPTRLVTAVTSGYNGEISETNISRGSVEVPEAVQTGDSLSQFRYFGYDGGNYIPSGGISVIIDNQSSVSSGSVPGKLVFATLPTYDPLLSQIKTMTFDSQGRLAINKTDAAATLDVNGAAIFDGYVKLGRYTDAQRNALTAYGGMLIYNTTVSKLQGRQNGVWINLDGTPL